MPIHVIRYFCVLAEELHFGRAAERLSITSPSLSQQIMRLEKQLNMKLFRRSARRVELTPRGRELLPLARRIRDEHDQLLSWAEAAQRESLAPVLKVGVVAAGAGALTTAAITATMQTIPEARIEMRRVGFLEVANALESRSVDVVFAPWPMELTPLVRAEPLWHETRVLVVRSDHRFADRDSVSIVETNDEILITVANAIPQVIDWWIVDPRPDGSRPVRGLTADSAEGMFELVAAGAGVNIASLSASSLFGRDELVFIPITDIEPATIVLCSLNNPPNPLVDTFRKTSKALAPLMQPTLR